MRPEAVGNMIRGKSGTQVVLDIFAGPKLLHTRVGITRTPNQQMPLQNLDDSMDREIPVVSRPKIQRRAPPPQPFTPPPQSAELSDYMGYGDAGYVAMSGLLPIASSAAVAPVTVAAMPIVSAAPAQGTLFAPQDSVGRCGVGLGFEFQPARGVLVLRSIAEGTESPFCIGDYLTGVNGTDVSSNSMLAPSLIWGDAGSSVYLTMIRGGETPRSVEAMLIREPSGEDMSLITMSGGGKTCGIGVVLELETHSQCFYVKRVVHGGPAFSAGVLQGDLVTHIDDKSMRDFTKDQLPSLILGPEGSVLHCRLMRAGETHVRELVITRFLDTAKAQQSNLASSAVLTFDYIQYDGSPAGLDKFSQSLQDDIVSALHTAGKRIHVVSVSLESGLANVHILPDFEAAADTRSVEELVRDFVYQGSTQRSMLRQKHTCKSLSKITILGQVDPTQAKLDLDLYSEAPFAHTPLQVLLVAASANEEEKAKEVLIRKSAPAATRTAAPPPSLPLLKIEDVEMMNSAEPNLLSPKVLAIVRATPTQMPSAHLCKTLDQATKDASPAVSPLGTSLVESDVAVSNQEEQVAENEESSTAAIGDNMAPFATILDDRFNDTDGQHLAVEESVEETGTLKVPAERPAELDLPIGRMLLAVLGHPQITAHEGEIVIQEAVCELVCTPEKVEVATEGCADEEGEDVVAQDVALKVLVMCVPNLFVSEDRVVVPVVSVPDVATEIDVDVVEEEAIQHVVGARSRSLRLVSVPAESSALDARDECLVSDSAALDAAEQKLIFAEAQIAAQSAGSALQIIESMDPSILDATDDTSMEKSAILDEAEQRIANNTLPGATDGLQAMGSNAWIGQSTLDDSADNHYALPIQLVAPPRPSRSAPTPAPDVLPAPPPRPSRGVDATRTSAVGVGTSAVSAITAHLKPDEIKEEIAPEEVQELNEKFPNRIPIVVSRAEYSIAPEIQGRKYLVPLNITAKNLHILISKRIDALPDGMRLVLSVGGAPLLGNGHRGIKHLLQTHSTHEGILDVMYDLEEGEINISQDLDESVHQTGGDACFEEQKLGSQSSSPVKLPAQTLHTVDRGHFIAESSQGHLKNWIRLDGFAPLRDLAPPVGNPAEESTNPLSLLIGLGNNIGHNIHQMAMPQPAEAPKVHTTTTHTPVSEPIAGVGLKIERDVSGKGFRITGVAPNGPAGKNGLVKVNDYLVAVGNVAVKDKKTDDAAGLLKGPEGSVVHLTLRTGEKMHVVTLVRSAVARQGKVKEAPKQPVPLAAKNDKVQIFGFSF